MAGQLVEGHEPRSRLDLPRRPGPRPATYKLPPHTQLDARPVPELVDELARHCFSLPDVHEEPTRISVPGARALLVDHPDAAVPSVRAMGGEFAHIHPDGSMHATLSLSDAETAIDAGWAASATNSGLLLLPLMAGVLTSSISSGRLITRTGRYKSFPVAGTATMALAMFLLSTMGPSTSYLLASVYMLVLGLGMGLVMQVLVVAVQNAVRAEDLGVATSSASFFRSLGGSFGTAFFGSILTSRLAYHLGNLVPSGAGTALGNLTGSPELIAQLPPQIRTTVVEAFSASITTVFASAIPFVLIAFGLVLLLPELPLRATAHIGSNPTPETT